MLVLANLSATDFLKMYLHCLKDYRSNRCLKNSDKQINKVERTLKWVKFNTRYHGRDFRVVVFPPNKQTDIKNEDKVCSLRPNIL